jgi:osmotically-inducible protein OsmY
MQPSTHEATNTKKDLAANDTANPTGAPPVAPKADTTSGTSASPTPMDQGENQKDLAITQEIRRSLMKDDLLSTTAKNVKVITADGVVTLRGPVNTQQEKQTIQDKARQVAGVLRVDNQLDVANR